MRISIWSYYFEGMSSEEMVETLADNGWNYAELSSEHGIELLQRVNPEKTGEAFKVFASERNVSFSQAHFDLGADLAQPPDSREKQENLDNMKRWCDLFIATGVRCGVLHPGGERLWKEGWKCEDTIKLSEESLRELVDYVKGTPLTLCLENSWHHEDTMHLVDTIDSPQLAVCMDTGHLNITGSNWMDFIKWAGKRLKALHIADNLGNGDHHMLPYGRGTINWQGFSEALREVGYEGLFNFEIGGESSNKPLPVRIAKLKYIRELAELMINEGPVGGGDHDTRYPNLAHV